MLGKPFEDKIQDLVYNVDVGIGLRLIKFGLYLLFLLFIMVIYTATQFRGLTNLDAMDNAQLGRNIMTKGHFVTSYIRPASMWYLIENSPGGDPKMKDHPDIVHAPVYPITLALGFKAMESAFTTEGSTRAYPPEQWVMVPLAHLCTLLTGLLVFLIGKRLFDLRVALLGATLFFLSDSVWAASISGTSLSLAGLLCTFAIFSAISAVARNQDDPAVRKWIFPYLAAAVFCILAFLTRYALAALTLPMALFIGFSFRKNGVRWAVLFLFIVLAGISPWLVRNYQVSGGLLGLAPYMALNGADPLRDNLFERSLAPVIDAGKIFKDLQATWMVNLSSFYRNNVLTMGDGILVCFFITTFFFSFSRPAVRRLRWAVALAVALLLFIAGFFGNETVVLLQVFWPIILLYGLAFFFILLDRLQIQVPILRIGVIIAISVITAVPLIMTLLPPRAAVPYPPYFPPYITHVCRMMNNEELLCTDMPWATAWYGDRTSLLLPATIDEFYEINDYTKRISGLYFTTITRDQNYVRSLLTGPMRSWFPLLEGRIPGDFPLTQGFPINNLDQLFLTDRPRWQEK